MRNSINVACMLAGLLYLASPVLAEQPAEKKPEAGKFIRLQRDVDDQPVKLETAIVRYRPASGAGGLTADLVSVVHIGDRDYYNQLNKQLSQYDVVLYELVAPPGTRIPKGGKKSDNPLALIQKGIKIVLDLDSQLECIDYTKKNFVHADLSPEAMAEAIHERGDDGLTLALGIAADLLRQQNLQERKEKKEMPKKDADIDFSSLLLDPEGPVKLKRLLAEQMVSAESPEAGLGQTLNTILIADRNKAALKVFQKELAAGKKKVAIFYGAGHMPDFEKRLKEDFGLKRQSEQWLTAWDIKVKDRGADALLELLKLLDQ